MYKYGFVALLLFGLFLLLRREEEEGVLAFASPWYEQRIAAAKKAQLHVDEKLRQCDGVDSWVF